MAHSIPADAARRWLLAQVALVTTIAVAAYVGWLPSFVSTIPGLDKVMHFLLFGGVAYWTARWLRPRAWWVRTLAVAGLVVLCALDELVQGRVPNRSLDGYDLLADWLGIAFFVALAERAR